MPGYLSPHLISPLPSTPTRRKPTGSHNSPKSSQSTPVRDKATYSPTGKGNLPAMDEEDLRSIISSSKLTPDQLKSISKSPLARRMHIVASNRANDKYVIPIPLTLRLPPRLSSPQRHSTALNCPQSSSLVSSPTRHKRQTLVYTSHGYEKIDISSSEDEQDDTTLPPVPEKPSLAKKPQPPSVATNKTKYLKLAFPNKEPDELSMIEEMSNFGSRNSSIARIASKGLQHERSKKLPNLPTEVEEVETTKHERSSLPSNKYTEANKVYTEAESVSTPRMTASKGGGTNVGKNNQAIHSVPMAQKQDPRPTHNRCFSETSQVSSVSSFSSAGAFGLASAGLKKGLIDRPAGFTSPGQNTTPRLTLVDTLHKPTHVNERLVSAASESSTSSSYSWNSLQQSIDISLNRGQEGVEDNSIDRKELADATDDQSIWSDVSPTDSGESGDEISPLNITRQNTDATSASIKSPMEKQVSNKGDSDYEHGGARPTFNFPNNSENITNSKSLKLKVLDEETKSAKPRLSFYSNGQIEIPDLSNGKIMEQYSSKSPSSYNETVFSERQTETSVSDVEQEDHPMRKIRVPSRDALRHFEEQFQLHSGGDDSDNESPWKSSALYAVPTISKTAPDLQCNFSQSRPNLASPPRHRRGKSMYNIDFNSQDKLLDCPLHQRAKSTDYNISSGLSGTSNASTNAKFLKTPNDTQDAISENLNIHVAEPPKAVNYAVDFKVNNAKQSDFGNKYTTPKELKKYHTPKSRHKSSSKRKSSSVCSSQLDDTDVESVVIDLTDDKYQVVTIQRSDSTLSYRSVTEKHKGKEVEVILLDDDEDVEESTNEMRRDEGDETDDELLSIYSKYRNDSWLFGSKSLTASEASFDTTSQNSNLIVKPKCTQNSKKLEGLRSLTTAGRIVHELNLKRSNTTTSFNTSSGNITTRGGLSNVALPRNPVNRASTSYLDDKYFDYTMNENYNFQTFMNERIN